MQPRQLQGIPLDGLADDGTVGTIQTCGPQGIERSAQTVVMEMRRVHWTLEHHLQGIAGQCLYDARQHMLAGERRRRKGEQCRRLTAVGWMA